MVTLGAEIVSAAAFPSHPKPTEPTSKDFSVYRGCPANFFNALNKPKPTFKVTEVKSVTPNTYNYTIDFSIDSGLTIKELTSLSLIADGKTYTLFNSKSNIKQISDPNQWVFSYVSGASNKSPWDFWVPNMLVKYEWENCHKKDFGLPFFDEHKRDAHWESKHKFHHHPGYKNSTKSCTTKSKYPSIYTYAIGCTGFSDIPGFLFKLL
ncbi:uncharacterized protein KQ657_002336 [Scheffersomyces spartinae]|uniref:Flo11 domain-containing protein n=1 Tax=Scheffersomyces spartinae TaxID=45513 RepID=A0A9P7VDR5_9ASCO|nr:uncharacterized protein KQ657_002336 [Scheffersomyces spartinae]KAG7195950.1 hypothetical protein KQ657_002336 [Scheffersomyces spartinae]